MKELSFNEAQQLLLGCTFLGTGGGGELSAGMTYAELAYKQGKRFRLAPLSELRDDELLCTPYALGSTVPTPVAEHQRRLPQSQQMPVLSAVEALQQHVGGRFAGTVACELGGENTAVAAYCAAMLDGVLVDGDAAGRAVPEITHSTYALHGLDPAPLTIASRFGETLLCQGIADDLRAEEIARSFAMVSCNDIAAADHALTAGELRGKLVDNSLKLALEIGRALNDRTTTLAETIQRINDISGGKQLFSGTVQATDSRIKDGFTIGRIVLQGQGDWTNHSCEIELKNENMLARVDGQLVVTIPELICLLDNDSRQPLTNPISGSGQSISVLICPAPKPFLSETGLRIFGPGYLGLNSAFQPYCTG